MMRILFAFMLATALQGHATGQDGFNLRERYRFLACVLTSVHPTDSCYYATGIIADTLYPYNTGAIFLKLGLDGQPLLVKTVKSTSKSYGPWFNDLLPLPDGGFVVDGETIDSVEKTLLMRFTADGDTVFTHEYPHPAYPAASFIQPLGGFVRLPGGGFVIANWVETGVGYDTDILLTGTDSMGSPIWNRTFATPMRDSPSSILLTPEGKVIVGGLRSNLNTNAEDFVFRTDIFQVDSLGNKEWEYLSPIGAGLRDAANDMLLLDDGSLVVASGTGHELVQSSLNGIQFDRHVFKLGPQHQLEWELTFPDPALSDWSRTVKLARMGDGSGYVLAGTEYAPKPYPAFKQPVKGWLAKISPDGDSVWTRRYAFMDDRLMSNSIYDMRQTADGGLLICGESYDWEEGATFPQQAWLLKVDGHGCLVPGCHLEDAAGEVPGPAGAGISIYPNPATDYLNLYLGARAAPGGSSVRIIDAAGHVRREFAVGGQGQTYIVPVWDWPGGTYWVQLASGGRTISTETFIKSDK